MKFLIWLVSLAAIGLALAIAVAGPGTKFGLWEYGDGLGIIRKAALPAMVAAGICLAAFVIALFSARGLAALALVAGLSAGAAAMVPVKMKAAVDANPFIHDITTDFDNPPQIVSGAGEQRNNPPEYVGAEPAPRSELTTAEAQREAFPDIETMRVAMSVEDAAAKASSVVTDMGMKLLSDGPVEGGWIIEAADTSFWFGFVDDFVVRIEPDGDDVKVDVRSKSRVGASDLGANAARVRAFMAAFESAA